MIKGGHNGQRKSKLTKTKKDAQAEICRENGRTRSRSRTGRREPRLQTGVYRSGSTLQMETKISSRRDSKSKGDQARSEAKRRSSNGRDENGTRSNFPGSSGDIHRIASHEKKESLGLEGPLYGRHLTLEQRTSLVAFIDEIRKNESLAAICRALEIHCRAYYRWKSGVQKSRHGGGGGLNKITPKEEKKVVALAKKKPDWHCRRIAYHLECKAKVFIGKTKVAEIMKEHGLNHPFEQKIPVQQKLPEDMLLFEPWRKNLLWGMDWTWVNVEGKFMFLLVLIDWYSRRIISWGLYKKITQFEVVTVVTEAVVIEQIDKLKDGELKPTVVADHGSANAAKYTKSNIEIQGLKLWLSGIGRPTGNARTERVIGTLKREEINLQEQYANEAEAKKSIGQTILDYNSNRPNQGNGGFAPNLVHHAGRAVLTKNRLAARQRTQEMRRKHWKQEQAPSTDLLT
jgi:putative transposase